MSIDVFSTAVLRRVVRSLDQPASFLLDTFFGEVQTEQSEEIHFDIDSSKPRITPFVSPLVAGKVVQDRGYQTKSFRPAYAKDKRRFDANAPFKRAIGEKLTGELSPTERRDRLLARSLMDQREMLTRRLEVMASEALRLGQVTVTGDQYPTVVVSFGRAGGLTVALTGGNRWGQAGVKPLALLETWHALIHTNSGAAATTVVMDPLAWALFSADADVKELLTRQAYRGMATLNLEPMAKGQGNDKAQYRGEVGIFRIWTYQDPYVDDAGADQKMLPDNTVIMGSPAQVEGVRCFGAIRDEEANFMAEEFFVKSWVEKDPSVRWLLLQSAPLVVPYRVNATFCATVN